MKKITILDYEEGKVFEYEVGKGVVEDFLIDKGHNPTNCEWMVH